MSLCCRSTKWRHSVCRCHKLGDTRNLSKPSVIGSSFSLVQCPDFWMTRLAQTASSLAWKYRDVFGKHGDHGVIFFDWFFTAYSRTFHFYINDHWKYRTEPGRGGGWGHDPAQVAVGPSNFSLKLYHIETCISSVAVVRTVKCQFYVIACFNVLKGLSVSCRLTKQHS